MRNPKTRMSGMSYTHILMLWGLAWLCAKTQLRMHIVMTESCIGYVLGAYSRYALALVLIQSIYVCDVTTEQAR